ncbi:hypothetical protein LSH36_540g01068 [Paralvinella palmiformis]|uniref:SHSP domain-containing protein n=1 Tax=Paralvinella palmiformis TaxID=53620 RepID=A0AAD9J6T5_9ANNE|nr:hypothetical protein LSH36_540g01068 [Paralvinella palmiformis]
MGPSSIASREMWNVKATRKDILVPDCSGSCYPALFRIRNNFNDCVMFYWDICMASKISSAMFALMAVTATHQIDQRIVPSAKGRDVGKTHAQKEQTFMDIFACRRCKKNKNQRRKNCTETEGSSSAEEEYSLVRGNGTNDSSNSNGHSNHNNNNNNNGSQVKRQLRGIKQEDSLKRPLHCKQSAARRQPIRKPAHGVDRSSQSSSASSGFLDGWRSLPNLRSPSLAVRAMTLKLKSLKSSEGHRDDDSGKVKAKKRARFNETVDVILQDDNGEPLCAQFVKIKYDDDGGSSDGGASSGCGVCLRGGHQMATAHRDGTNGPSSPGEGSTGGNSSSGGRPRGAAAANRRRTANPDSIRMDLMDIKRNADGQRYLKCVIFIGEEFDRRRITVRTAMGGSKLVLVAYRTEPLGDGTYYWQQFVERFRLPHAIDPHQVNAVMHSAGDLVIEAPLFEFEADS